MADRSNVPPFGNWENEDNVPYTVYFDKARRKRGGKMINPNDPQENHEMLSNLDPSPSEPAPAANSTIRPEERVGVGRGTPEHRVSKENGDFRPYNNSPSRGENKSQKSSIELNSGGRGQKPGRAPRTSGGSEQSSDRSPLHPYYQAKVTGRGSGSPAWEGKNHDNSHGTPSRSRLRPTAREDESPDKGAAVPRFGEWDENDPQSAENFTHIFDKVREERNSGAGNVSGTPRHPSYVTRGQQAHEPKKCCFPWW
ncbi:hypothetical protein CDL12_23764 [Handroanthus impetiginosus]|uniref:RIN4 pathogenic type III effector avirulence factor Avr cleavage site domain-containing protein n=1 Tax=Handroanthus impetiginosus TaxID=429701 RepID=A0A2G9GEK7_9LAMI|nr:hypothetical protein CDL12_23764 [Handroanthus impetiginosus]